MPKFKSEDEVYEVLGALFQRLLEEPELGPELKGLNMSLRFNFKEPQAEITLNCHGDDSTVDFGTSDWEPDLTLSMKADDGHRLWLGTMNPVVGMAKRKIKTDGDLMKAMALQSVLDPATEIYRSLLVGLGRTELLEK